MAELKAIVAPLLQRLPGTEEQKLAIVVGGAAFSVATLCCACGSRTTAVPTAAPATAAVSAEVAAGMPSAVTKPPPEQATAEEKTPAKERKRPAPVETGTPAVASSSLRGRPATEAVAEMLGRRQQVLDEIVAVDAECVRQLRALDKHFVGEHTSAPRDTHHSMLVAL